MKKPSAADRTANMFPDAVAMDSRVVETTTDDAKDERVPIEQDVDSLRERAFTVQQWTTKHFGLPEAPGNEYRVSLKGQHYYVETLRKTPGSPNAYGYVGLMVAECDLYNLAACLVQAVRSKQEREKNGKAIQIPERPVVRGVQPVVHKPVPAAGEPVGGWDGDG